MVTDHQVRRLFAMVQSERTKKVAAIKAGMDEKTARKYIRQNKLPSQMKRPHTWRTREDPFKEVWGDIRAKLSKNPGLEAKTLFIGLQKDYPGEFSDGQLRTLQRRIKQWKALEGHPKEVYFPQEHHPGVLCASDFTSFKSLGITIQKHPFPHLLYHFVLTYSNWETGTVCYSESFESMSAGLQNALWELGGVPHEHLTDRLTAAVQKVSHPEEFTQRYQALLRHYKLSGRKTQGGKAHENGDIEQRHHRLKRAVEQSLLLRGSRDFTSHDEYCLFLKKVFAQLNAGRRQRLQEEAAVLRPLPHCRLDDSKELRVKVSPSSMIRVAKNGYSVDSRLIGEYVTVRLLADTIELWYAQKMVDRFPRLRGTGRYQVNYRHIIDWLVRKPGAFEQYRYRDAMFPSSHFRMAFDHLRRHYSKKQANREYLSILKCAAYEGEAIVNDALRILIDTQKPISKDAVMKLVQSEQTLPTVADVMVQPVNLSEYDELFYNREVC